MPGRLPLNLHLHFTNQSPLPGISPHPLRDGAHCNARGPLGHPGLLLFRPRHARDVQVDPWRVVNKFLQVWDVPNVFSMGAGAFPQNAGYNPTATLAALAYYSAAAIKSQYLKAPGPLVRT